MFPSFDTEQYFWKTSGVTLFQLKKIVFYLMVYFEYLVIRDVILWYFKSREGLQF